MKEITRIHLAKTAYDIEVTAKKELEQYIGALEKYANDATILEDIEIRMTELLAERGVERDCVIAASDVQAVRKQLGEPQDFAEDSEVATLPASNELKPTRRLYRDYDKALVGGVLSGIATYFGVNPLWTRLVFIALLLVSFGTIAIVYIVLWIVLPPARTAAEKLELEGKPVTLAAIKERSEDSSMTEAAGGRRTADIVQRIALWSVGLLAAFTAMGALIATAVVGLGLLFGFGTSDNSPFASLIFEPSWQAIAAYVLFIISGLLLAALGFLVAHASFTRRFAKRTGIAVATIIIAGITVFSLGVGMFVAGVDYSSRRVQEAMIETTVELPKAFSDVKNLSITAHSVQTRYGGAEMSVEYVVDSGKPRYELRALPGLEPDIVIDGANARIAFKSNALQNRLYEWVQPQLIIRGPALESAKVEQGGFHYTAQYPDGQRSLKLDALPTTNASVMGKFSQLQVVGAGEIDLSQATVSDVMANIDGGSVTAGVVRSLAVTQPEACPSSTYEDWNVVKVSAVTSGKLTRNGVEQSVKTDDKVGTMCGSIIVGDEDSYESWED